MEPTLGTVSPEALRDWLTARGESRYRADQVLRWIYQKQESDFRRMSNLPQNLREELAQTFTVPVFTPEDVRVSADNTRKLLFRIPGGFAIESVLIPDPPRLTLCVSSQAGCAMGCGFCATARLGLQRNLTASEIIAQVRAASALLATGERISNLVFMGMGEPLHNYDAVKQSIEVLTAEWGSGFSTRRVTVSTVGLVPQLERLVAETDVSIAVSLTATTDELRNQLMPVNKKYPLASLIAACRRLPIPKRRRITFEYVLLAGVNDSPEDAQRLVRLLRGLRCKVNLIPFNEFPEAPFRRPADAAIESFQRQLLASDLHATVRTSRGRDVAAACGQLAAIPCKQTRTHTDGRRGA